MKMSTKIIRIGKAEVPNPVHGDVKLSVFPFENTKNKMAAIRSKNKYATSNIASIISGTCGL